MTKDRNRFTMRPTPKHSHAGTPASIFALPAWRKQLCLILVGLIPPLIVILGVEGFARIFKRDSSFINIGFGEEHFGVVQPHPELFWSLRPASNLLLRTTRVSINRLGLRNEELPRKEPEEIRILSLGESTTFGVGVEQDEPYSKVLEGMLKQNITNRMIRV